MASLIAAAPACAASEKPIVFWFFTTVADSPAQCPVSSPDFDVVSVDLPSHGSDYISGEPIELDGWRYRLDRGQHLLDTFVTACSAKLDQMLSRRPNAKVFAGGISRGAFAAMHLSVRDRRFASVLALSPVVDLRNLAEFADYRGDGMSLVDQADSLADRRVFLSIESQDDRVSTRSTLRLADSVVALHRATDLTVMIESGQLHTITSAVRAAARSWIEERSR